jgi:kynurenine formamidase
VGAGADIREGDILVLHTGWHRHYEGRTQQDLVKYFCYHPGPNLERTTAKPLPRLHGAQRSADVAI